MITKTCQQGLYIGDCTDADVHDNDIIDCGYVSKDYHSVDVRGTCSNVTIENNNLIRNDTTLSPYIFVSHSTGDVVLQNNTISNGKILLYSGSSGMTIQGNNATINDLSGKKHSIIK